jgi:hypothetical protein
MWKSLGPRSGLYGGCEFPLDIHFFLKKSYDGIHLAFGRTLDRRCHFKHVSLKVGSTIVKRARLTSKGSRSTAVLPKKHKKFSCWPTCDVSLLSGYASYILSLRSRHLFSAHSSETASIFVFALFYKTKSLTHVNEQVEM